MLGETRECPVQHSKDKEIHLVSYITLPWWVFPWEASPELFFFFQCQSDDLSRSVPLIKSVGLVRTFSAVFIRDEVCHVGFVCNKIILVKIKHGIIHTLSLLLGTFINNKKNGKSYDQVKNWMSSIIYYYILWLNFQSVMVETTFKQIYILVPHQKCRNISTKEGVWYEIK